MFVTLLLFFAGFYILINSANFLVDGSSALARRFNISNIVIGLIIAGIGTSIPEFAITFIANLTGDEHIGLGTIIGSNTFNIMVILGVSAIFFPLSLRPEWVRRDLVWNIGAVLAVLFFALVGGNGVLSQIEGLFMLGIFAFWLYWVIAKENHAEPPEEESIRILTLPIAFVFILVGLVGVIFGGKWIVEGAEVIARELGMSEALLGLTIIGIGTSLPEFAITFTAAFKRQPGIAIGSIIGSNIFDFLMILGVTSFIKPVAFSSHFFTDILVTLASAIALFGFMFVGQRNVLKRWQGLLFLLFYILYIMYLIRIG